MLGEGVEGVVGLRVEERVGGLGLEAIDLQFVDVPDLHALHSKMHLKSVGRDGGLLNGRMGMVYLGAAILLAIDVGIGFHRVPFYLRGQGCIDWFGEGKQKTVWLNPHRVNLKGCYSRPLQSFHGEVARSTRSPSAIGAANKHHSVRRKFYTHDPGLKS